MLGDWQDAPCVVLSCPGPLRRHSASVQKVGSDTLPQMLLGSESQLLAFAARAGRQGGGARLVFTPFPEMFADAGRLTTALDQAGLPAGDGMVHLRFGGVRSARVLKGVRNAAVLAECVGAPLLTASHHPFASGLVLPAAMQRVYRLSRDVVRAAAVGAGALPGVNLPAGLVRAMPAKSAEGGGRGLEVIGLEGFQSEAWAAGLVRGLAGVPDGAPTVLVPWNMDHPGSIVPELLARFARLCRVGDRLPRLVLLPFNYIGQTGIIRELIAQLRAASEPEGTLLPRLFLARVRSLAGVAALRRLSRTAWVDGNDPEHWWTLGRLAACGINSVLIGAGAGGNAEMTGRGEAFAVADEALRVEAETRCGMLIFQARVPARRSLAHLLAVTADRQARFPADPALPGRSEGSAVRRAPEREAAAGASDGGGVQGDGASDDRTQGGAARRGRLQARRSQAGVGQAGAVQEGGLQAGVLQGAGARAGDAKGGVPRGDGGGQGGTAAASRLAARRAKAPA